MTSIHRKRPLALRACSSKRRPRTVAAADAAASAGNAASWASLPQDLIDLIGQRVLAGDMVDYIRFRAVCPHWRRNTPDPLGRSIIDPRFHPRQWMMLPEGRGLYPGHSKLRGYVRFFNVSTGAFIRVQLPLFKDHCALDSIDGILLLQRDHDTAIRLLHPFTGDIADFPPLTTILPYVSRSDRNQWWLIRSISAASISVSMDEVVTVMMLLPATIRVVFAISGDQQWRASSWSVEQVYRPLAFKGKLYFFRRSSSYSGVEVLEINPPQQEGMDLVLLPPKLIAKCPGCSNTFFYRLVECNSEILVVVSGCGVDTKFLVYRLADLVLERVVLLTSINGNSLFVGWNNLCVSSNAFPAIAGDTIVFTQPKRRYLIQYHLSSGKALPTTDVYTGVCTTLGPLNIFYYIFTCCYRARWNKGQLVIKDMLKGWGVKRKWRDGVPAAQVDEDREVFGRSNHRALNGPQLRYRRSLSWVDADSCPESGCKQTIEDKVLRSFISFLAQLTLGIVSDPLAEQVLYRGTHWIRS